MRIFFLTLGIWYLISGCGLNNRNSNQCSPRIKSSSTGTVFGFEVLDKSNCTIDEETYRTLIQKWLSERDDNAVPLEGMNLGSTEQYPWISKYLARAAIQSQDWDHERGRSSVHPHSLVESLLLEETFRHRLEAPFADTPYIVHRVSLEKLLIGDVSTVLDQYEKGVGTVPMGALMMRVEFTERSKE